MVQSQIHTWKTLYDPAFFLSLAVGHEGLLYFAVDINSQDQQFSGAYNLYVSSPSGSIGKHLSIKSNLAARRY